MIGATRADGNHLNRWHVYSHLRRNQILHHNVVSSMEYVPLDSCRGEFFLIDVIDDKYASDITKQGVRAHVLTDVHGAGRITYVGYTYRPLWLSGDLARRLKHQQGNVMFFDAAEPDPWRHSLVTDERSWLDGRTFTMRSKTHSATNLVVTLRAIDAELTMQMDDGGDVATIRFDYVFPHVVAKREAAQFGLRPVDVPRWPVTLPAFFEQEGVGTTGPDAPFYRLVNYGAPAQEGRDLPESFWNDD